MVFYRAHFLMSSGSVPWPPGTGRRDARRMRQSIDRRTVLKASLAGVGATVLLPGVALADDDGGFPPVPGMLGDRRANEMWFTLDERTFYHPAQEVVDAYGAIGALVGGENPFFGMLHVKGPPFTPSSPARPPGAWPPQRRS